MEILTTPQSNLDVIRSWKDPKYRRSLTAQQLQAIPEHPAGSFMITEQEMKVASGLMMEDEDFSIPLTTALGCTDYTFHSWKSCGC
ncbi:MAG TPA: mersacidin/lichenicidin family type 2 lantibiotic [Candidatus Limnocylindrales bacterium]|jgi:mersacidin/lichenicidin family type 2 lantibiotic|nr:mersacidin/lichenicidin family type 2 lantibiotic [Candidatus Limnocylindrales bacterium]